MRLVVDTNVVIACLLKSGITQDVFFNSNLELYSCDYLIIEIEKHQTELMEASGYDESTFKLALSMLLRHVSLIPHEEYDSFMARARNSISDKDDAPFVALGLKLNAPIWTHDKQLLKASDVQTITTKKIIDELNTK